MLIRLAWRNIWRNSRRTWITMSSVFFSVVLATLMMSLKEGVYEKMIDSIVGGFTGYVQIQKVGYWDDKNIDNSLYLDDSLFSILRDYGIQDFLPRVESFGLIASDSGIKGSLVVGIDPNKEDRYNHLNNRIFEGEFLKSDDKSVLVGKGLASSLKIKVQDTLVLLGQGYHGTSAAGKYPVKGLLNFGSPEISNRLIMLPLAEAQKLYGLENHVTNIILKINSPKNAKSISSDIGRLLGNNFEVMEWKELLPELQNLIETDRAEGHIFMFILYMVITFGIFGTMLMMLAERQHEFGVMVAIGMKKIKLGFIVWAEVVIISIIGAIAGILGSLPVCIYFHFNPIQFSQELSKMMEEYGIEAVLQASIHPIVFLQQALIVASISCLIALYPFFKLLQLNAVKSMRN